MIRTVEAVIDERGNVRLLESVELTTSKRAFVMILDDSPPVGIIDSAILSEQALGKDWNREEEDAAWTHLQRAR